LAIVASLAAVALAALAVLTWRWTFTPYGRLDWRAAASLKLLTFDYTFKPDARSDFALTLPINLLYPLSMLMPAEGVGKVADVSIPAGDRSLSARVYWPESHGSGDTRLPGIVYYIRVSGASATATGSRGKARAPSGGPTRARSRTRAIPT